MHLSPATVREFLLSRKEAKVRPRLPAGPMVCPLHRGTRGYQGFSQLSLCTSPTLSPAMPPSATEPWSPTHMPSGPLCHTASWPCQRPRGNACLWQHFPGSPWRVMVHDVYVCTYTDTCCFWERELVDSHPSIQSHCALGWTPLAFWGSSLSAQLLSSPTHLSSCGIWTTLPRCWDARWAGWQREQASGHTLPLLAVGS